MGSTSVQQRSMFRRDAHRSHYRRDRLNTLALARHQQSRAIILQRSRPVHVTEHLRQTLDILHKTRFARSRLVIHLRRRDPINESPEYQNSAPSESGKMSDSVELANLAKTCWQTFFFCDHLALIR